MTPTTSEIEDNPAKMLSIAVDPEHSGIRTMGCLAFGIFSIIGSIITSTLLPNFGLLSLVIGVILGIAVTYFADLWMKQNWPSGRSINLSDTYIRIVKQDTIEREINPQQQTNLLLWKFEVKRNTRVPKGWFVVACSLQQEDTYLPIYTLVSPEQLKQLKYTDHLVTLESKKQPDAFKPNENTIRLAGIQRRLHDAETDRSLHGAEMTPEQFNQYLTYLQEYFPKWMPSH